MDREKRVSWFLWYMKRLLLFLFPLNRMLVHALQLLSYSTDDISSTSISSSSSSCIVIFLVPCRSPLLFIISFTLHRSRYLRVFGHINNVNFTVIFHCLITDRLSVCVYMKETKFLNNAELNQQKS